MIDLSIDGANRITGLSAEDVFEMTDDRNILKIFGDEDDSVTLSDDEWHEADPHMDGDTKYLVYQNTDNNVTLHVQDGVNVQGVIID